LYRRVTFYDWLPEELELLARACPKGGEEILKQVYQWQHELSKAWALALLGSAFAFLGTAALSLVKSELDVRSWATWTLVATGGAAILAGALQLRRLRALLPEYLLTVQTYGFYRNSLPASPD